MAHPVRPAWYFVPSGQRQVLAETETMAAIARKYNPGFLTDDELVASFCVRTREFKSIVEMLRECTGSSNPHQIVIGPRGSGKTSLLLRVAAEVRGDVALSAHFFPIVFAEESYEVATTGEFWLECLSRLAAQAPRRDGGPDLERTVEDLRTNRDDRTLAGRCLASLLDFADREGKRLVLMVENLNMMFRDMADPDSRVAAATHSPDRASYRHACKRYQPFRRDRQPGACPVSAVSGAPATSPRHERMCCPLGDGVWSRPGARDDPIVGDPHGRQPPTADDRGPLRRRAVVFANSWPTFSIWSMTIQSISRAILNRFRHRNGASTLRLPNYGNRRPRGKSQIDPDWRRASAVLNSHASWNEASLRSRAARSGASSTT